MHSCTFAFRVSGRGTDCNMCERSALQKPPLHCDDMTTEHIVWFSCHVQRYLYASSCLAMHAHMHQRSRTRHNETQRSVCIGVKLHNCEAFTLLHYSFWRVFTCGEL